MKCMAVREQLVKLNASMDTFKSSTMVTTSANTRQQLDEGLKTLKLAFSDLKAQMDAMNKAMLEMEKP